ncbi:thiolase family protein [Anaerolineales bacterium HSG25]|nr:thiolase family protein [Anaerolineales bacterium HSG25]
MKDVYIVSAVRTPMGKYGGALLDVSPVDLGAHAMKAAVEKAGINGGDLDFYAFGNILKHGHGQLVPRHAAIKAGIPKDVDGYALDMLCSSAMMTAMNASYMIKAEEADMVLCGGTESMSQTGFLIPYQARYGLGLSAFGGPIAIKDVLLDEGLTDPMEGDLMGKQTDRLAADYNVTREELDNVAYLSHKNAHAATVNGDFAREIAPLEVTKRRKTTLIETDDGIRPETTMESLGKLRAAFGRDGLLTAGSSSQISDGAAALILASKEAVEKHNLSPVARLTASAWAAGEPWRFVEAPVPAIEKVVGKLGLTVEDFDLFENNEAFSLNNVLLNKRLNVPYEKINIYGGAIALGHPIGCSGARIIVTLLNALGATGGKRGIASLCHGTGGGTAVAVEML